VGCADSIKHGFPRFELLQHVPDIRDRPAVCTKYMIATTFIELQGCPLLRAWRVHAGHSPAVGRERRKVPTDAELLYAAVLFERCCKLSSICKVAADRLSQAPLCRTNSSLHLQLHAYSLLSPFVGMLCRAYLCNCQVRAVCDGTVHTNNVRWLCIQCFEGSTLYEAGAPARYCACCGDGVVLQCQQHHSLIWLKAVTVLPLKANGCKEDALNKQALLLYPVVIANPNLTSLVAE
jgi:hypothetical protein